MGVEKKLYNAFRLCKGVRLTEQDVADLLTCDEAIQTRIVNTANRECGEDEPGTSHPAFGRVTWRGLVYKTGKP
jgi:hypothetical protein